jgi:hypothetical protein
MWKKLQKGLPLNGLRRNDVAIENNSWYQKKTEAEKQII